MQWERDFVNWWDANVGTRKGQFGGKGLKNADPGFSISKDKAEAETKISQQQVSRWRNGLKRPDRRATQLKRTGAGRATKGVKSGLFLPTEMVSGSSEAAFYSTVESDLPARLAHELFRILGA